MRIALKLFVFFSLSISVWAGGGLRFGSKPINPYERSLTNITFDAVDFTLLRSAARQVYPETSPSELDLIVQRNVKFIFHNKLNRRHFLVAPEPSLVVIRIARVFQQCERLDALLDRGYGLLGESAPPSEFRPLMVEIGETADQLRDLFSGYFIEGRSSPYRLQVTPSAESLAQFSHFLVQCRRIRVELERSLGDYFFSDDPGAVTLDFYGTTSVVTLTESMRVLADLTTGYLDGPSR